MNACVLKNGRIYHPLIIVDVISFVNIMVTLFLTVFLNRFDTNSRGHSVTIDI